MAIQFSSQRLKVAGVANSMIGGRPDNQDSWGYADTPVGFLLAVCDGMGGGPGGKQASQTVVAEVIKSLAACSSQSSPTEALKRAVAQAEQALDNMMEAHAELRGMGSTLVAVLISEQSAHIAHLGDSRCYQISRGKAVFRTDDHSLVGELVRNKAMTEEQARMSPQSNVITRALGNTSNHVAQIDEVCFRQGDRFILCTDGVWGVMPHEQLLQRLTAPIGVGDLADGLSMEVDRLGRAGSDHFDNHTIAVLEINMNSIQQQRMTNTAKIIIVLLAGLLVVSLLFNVFGRSDTNAVSTDVRAQLDQLQLEVSQLSRANSDLEGYKLRYEQLTRERAGNYSYELDWLMAKNDSLSNLIVELEERIAELQQQLQTAKAGSKGQSEEQAVADKTSLSAGKKGAAGKTHPAKSIDYGRLTAYECTKAMLQELQNMRDVKSKNMKDVTATKARGKDIVENLMIQLDQKTSRRYSGKIDGMRRLLMSNDAACLKADRPDAKGFYGSTKVGVRDLDKLIEKTREIQKELKR